MKRKNCLKSEHIMIPEFFGSFASLIISIVVIITVSSCTAVRQIGSAVYASNDFFRVDAFPSDEQIATVGSTGKGIEHVYNAPRSRVWSSVRRIAERMDKLSRHSTQGTEWTTRPLTAANDVDCALKIGNIIDPGEVGNITNGVGINRAGNDWIDEFVIKVDILSPTQTKVRIIRRVAESVKTDHYALRFKLQDKISTGNYERWFLTQVEDDLGTQTGK